MKIGQFYRVRNMAVVCVIVSLPDDEPDDDTTGMMVVESAVPGYVVGEVLHIWSFDDFIRVKHPRWETRGYLGINPASYPIGNFLQIDMSEYGPLTCVIISRVTAGESVELELVVVGSIHPAFKIGDAVEETELTEYRKVKRPKWKDKK